MKRTGRTLLSLALCLVLLMGMLPLSASAAGAVTLNVESGNIRITASGYSVGGAAETPHTGKYVITGAAQSSMITVESGAPKITLSRLTVDVSAREMRDGDDFSCAFLVSPGASATLTLSGDNTLKSGQGRAGLQVPAGASVSIDGTGSLHAEGGFLGAGIGGGVERNGKGQNAGSVAIGGNTKITAVGGGRGAGIGGGGGDDRPILAIQNSYWELLETADYDAVGTYTVKHGTDLAGKAYSIASGIAADGDVTTGTGVDSGYFGDTPATYTTDYGRLSVYRDGTWRYALDPESAALQALKGGEPRTETFNVAVTDLYGKYHTQPITIKITGVYQPGELEELKNTRKSGEPVVTAATVLPDDGAADPNLPESMRGGHGASVAVTGGVVRASSIGGGTRGPGGDADGDPGSLTIQDAIVFQGTAGKVGGNVGLAGNLTVSQGESLLIPGNATLTIPKGKTLTIEVGGEVVNNGIIYLRGSFFYGVPGRYGELTGTGRIISIPVPSPSLERGEHFSYLHGYPDNTIRPEANLTREETAMMFYNLMDDASRAQYESAECPFADVEAGRWSYKAICALANAGILKGDPDGSFRPAGPVTRAEFASIAARFDPGTYEGDDLFPDISRHWARQDINYAAGKKWVQGYEDGTFRPNGKITRAEAATLINRVLERAPETIEDLLLGRRAFTDNANEKAWYYLALEEAANSHDYKRKNYSGLEETWTALQ